MLTKSQTLTIEAPRDLWLVFKEKEVGWVRGWFNDDKVDVK